jgi:hypothetical protein
LDKRNVFNSFHVRTIVDGEGNKTAMMAETTQNRLHLELNQEDFEDVSVRTESRLGNQPKQGSYLARTRTSPNKLVSNDRPIQRC